MCISPCTSEVHAHSRARTIRVGGEAVFLNVNDDEASYSGVTVTGNYNRALESHAVLDEDCILESALKSHAECGEKR